MKKINHGHNDKVTDVVDFRGRRTSKEGMPVKGVDFCKILALLPLQMLIFLQFIPAKQGFHSSTSLNFQEMQELKLFQDKKKIFLVQVGLSM